MLVCKKCLEPIDKFDFYVEAPHEDEKSFTPYASVGTSCCNSSEAIRMESGYTAEDLREQGMNEHNEDIFQEVDSITIDEYENL